MDFLDLQPAEVAHEFALDLCSLAIGETLGERKEVLDENDDRNIWHEMNRNGINQHTHTVYFNVGNSDTNFKN